MITNIKKPRCFILTANAPLEMPASTANRVFNDFVNDRDLPLVIFHDHFIGRPGGVAIFYCETQADREALASSDRLSDWEINIHPLIFSSSPSAFDEQIAYTLRSYRETDWTDLRQVQRPRFGNPSVEAETASEE